MEIFATLGGEGGWGQRPFRVENSSNLTSPDFPLSLITDAHILGMLSSISEWLGLAILIKIINRKYLALEQSHFDQNNFLENLNISEWLGLASLIKIDWLK